MFMKESLSRYCKERRVNYRGLKYWMKKNPLSVPSSKQSSRQSGPSFVPVSVLSSEPLNKNTPVALTGVNVIKGVKISLRNGMKTTMGEISGKNMIQNSLHLLKNYC
jgi:hypothetical protein